MSISPVPGIGDSAPQRPDLAVGAVGAVPSTLSPDVAARLAAARAASTAAAARYSSTTVSRPGLPHDALYRLTSPSGLMIVSGNGAASGVPSALALPMTHDGVPDVQALRDNDVIVRGAIPPNGEAVRSQSSMLSHQAYFAFDIDFQDGNGPLFVKGGNVRFDPAMAHSPQASSLAQNTLEAIRRLPNSYAEYQQQRGGASTPAAGGVNYSA